MAPDSSLGPQNRIKYRICNFGRCVLGLISTDFGDDGLIVKRFLSSKRESRYISMNSVILCNFPHLLTQAKVGVKRALRRPAEQPAAAGRSNGLAHRTRRPGRRAAMA